jgi:hypothetical protein
MRDNSIEVLRRQSARENFRREPTHLYLPSAKGTIQCGERMLTKWIGRSVGRC